MAGYHHHKYFIQRDTHVLFRIFTQGCTGNCFGLIFYYSKNIWLNILLHFLNNALVVTQLYVMFRKGKPIDKTIDESLPMWWGLVALILLIFVFRVFRKESTRVLERREQMIHSSPENILS
jgi:hypothetical protein